MRHVQRSGSALSGSEFVMQFIDEFEPENTGPSGLHRCIISEVLGPPTFSDIEDLYPSEGVSILRKEWLRSLVAWNIYIIVGLSTEASSLNFNEFQYHTKRTPDLHLKNILFHLPTIASWSPEVLGPSFS